MEGKRRAVEDAVSSDSESNALASGWLRRNVRGDWRWGEDMGEDGGERVKLFMRAVAFRLEVAVGVMSRLAREPLCCDPG